MSHRKPLVVLSHLFPSAAQPGAGLFIRERMFRVAQHHPVTVISPQAWFPGQSVLRAIRPSYRILGSRFERQSDIEVYRPRAFSVPFLGRRHDALSMALSALPIIRRLRQQGRCEFIDAHFAYPDGYAASLLSARLKIPFFVTLRGTESRHLMVPALRRKILRCLQDAHRIFTVSESLRQLVLAQGISAEKVEVVGNGVDTSIFYPSKQEDARIKLNIPLDAKVLITVGALVERKGFHRVIAQLPRLIRTYKNLVYLIVGGPSPEGDWSQKLKSQVSELALENHVRFLGPLEPSKLRIPLSAANVSVLASSNEGWANVILESMACGVPVVASDVGGNAEVIRDEDIGKTYPFNNDNALFEILHASLAKDWDRAKILAYAKENVWEKRITQLLLAFQLIG